MKKLFVLVFVACFISACSTSSSKNSSFSTRVDNANTVVVDGSNIEITNQDFYEYLMSEVGADLVLDRALALIADNVITDEALINQEIEKIINNYNNMLGDVSIEEYVVETLGYVSFEEYQEKVLIPNAKHLLLIRKYTQDNFETLAKEYNFKKIKMITFDAEAVAHEISSSIKDGEITFEEAFEEYNTSTSQKEASLGVVSTLSASLDSSIITLLSQFESIGYYPVPVSLSNGSSWAVIFIEEVNIEVMRDDIESTLSNHSIIRSRAELHYLNEYNFEVFEKIIENKIKSFENNYLG
jgi:hypothetical protein